MLAIEILFRPAPQQSRRSHRRRIIFIVMDGAGVLGKLGGFARKARQGTWEGKSMSALIRNRPGFGGWLEGLRAAAWTKFGGRGRSW